MVLGRHTQKKQCTIADIFYDPTRAYLWLSAHLHMLASQDPVTASPAASSLSSATAPSTQSPTSQQVLTARLLLALLEVPPQFALPLAKVKELLSAKESVGTMAGASNRVLYGCVAKRLMRIDRDRGKGEQTVRFDI